MKTMTCKQLGGACELSFTADTFDEIAKLSRQHGLEMIKIGDPEHIAAMNNMRTRMEKAGAMDEWIKDRRAEFDQLPGE